MIWNYHLQLNHLLKQNNEYSFLSMQSYKIIRALGKVVKILQRSYKSLNIKLGLTKVRNIQNH